MSRSPEQFDVEELVDLLLKIVGRDDLYPAYPQSRNVYREVVDFQRAPQLAPLHRHLQVEAVALLRRREIAMMLRHTPLTQRQREAIHLFLQGYTFEEMAKRWGVSKQAAHRVFLRACATIRASWRGHPLNGITLAYLESTLRRYARPTRWLNREENS